MALKCYTTHARPYVADKAALSLMADRSHEDNDIRISGLGLAMELCSDPQSYLHQ